MIVHSCRSWVPRTFWRYRRHAVSLSHPFTTTTLLLQGHDSNIRRQSDLIVVGSGFAGLCASIAAAEKGATVLLLDAAHGGGASYLSGGVVYAGGGTRQQKEAGYGDDTPENMYAYLKQETGDTVDDKTLREFCEGSVERMEWLEKHGARFEASLCPYKTSYPTDQHYLYYSGSEKSPAYAEQAKPAPRGHRMVQPGFSGSALWRALFEYVKRLGNIEFLPASRVQRVILGASGRAEGVEYKTLSSMTSAFSTHQKLNKKAVKNQLFLPSVANMYTRRADAVWKRESHLETAHAPSIILAAGGFAFNPAMRQRYLPEFSKVAPLGTPNDDGSGIKLGQEAGGSVSNMNSMSAWRFLYPPTALLEGVVVAKGGERMIAEDVYGSTLSEVMIRRHDSTGYLVLDSRQWAKAKQQLPKQTTFPLSLQRMHWLYWNHVRSDSLEALARTAGIAPDGLQQTVEAYNAAISDGRRDPMKKAPEYCTSISKPPYYLVDISPRIGGIQLVNGLTLGGLRVDGETGLVLTETNDKIMGLYAAGRTAAGICANGYVSGLSIADCVFSGRRAGEHAAGFSLVDGRV